MTTESATFREPFEEIEPVRLTLGTYREMEYDAKLELDGLTWYRAQGGFGDRDDRHPREDWVLALPEDAPSTSITRGLKQRSWGWPDEYATQREAMRARIEQTEKYLGDRIEEETVKLSNLFRARDLLNQRET